MASATIWFGLFEVIPKSRVESVLGNAVGAFVNAVGISADEFEFVERVSGVLAAVYGLDTVDQVEIEPLSVRMERAGVSDLIIDLAATLNDRVNVAFGAFQTYAADDS